MNRACCERDSNKSNSVERRTLRATSSADLRATDRDRVDLYGGASNADGNALPVFAAGPNTVTRCHVGPEHGDLAQDIRPVADQVHALERRGELSVFDQVALGQREHEISVRNIHLTAAKALRKNAS